MRLSCSCSVVCNSYQTVYFPESVSLTWERLLKVHNRCVCLFLLESFDKDSRSLSLGCSYVLEELQGSKMWFYGSPNNAYLERR